MKANQELLYWFLSHFGEKEHPSPTKSNPFFKKILDEMAGEMGINGDDSEVAGCSIVMNYACKQLRIKRSHKPNARSWAKLDVETRLVIPSNVNQELLNRILDDKTFGLVGKQGDIGVFWRHSPNDWRGHVGLFVRRKGDAIYVLGANQDNSICIKPYPISRLLCVIRPEFEMSTGEKLFKTAYKRWCNDF